MHGTEGSLSPPDPNMFDGPVQVWPTGSKAWRLLPVSAGYEAAGRGIGLALRAGCPHLASAEHVLDVMLTLLDSAHRGQALPETTTCERPAPVC
ncbi:hypothetical protein [Streptomyces phaeochromogenes]|uniref:hypothetical protein n=1 Tax=Streptomyces phaeochromogenes TaxID=1923 RepID=UPI003721C7B8